MDISLLYEVQMSEPSSAEEQDGLRHAVKAALLADELGFDRFYCVEHHGLNGYSHSSAPEVTLSYIAAKTSRIRIAHGVACLPFKMNHPVRVAERTATLDILSNGRLDVGFGRSSSAFEQKVFGVNAAETTPQLIEGMRAIVEMWTADEIEWQTDSLEIPRRKIRPQPLQNPHPPIMMACSREDTFEIAGRMGLGVLSSAADGPERARYKRGLFDAARAKCKREDVIGKYINDHFGCSVFACVLDDSAEARSWGLRGLRYHLESVRHYFSGGEAPKSMDEWTDENSLSALRELLGGNVKAANGPGEKLSAGLLNGTMNPDDVLNPQSSAMGTANGTIDFLERMEDAGVNECYFILQMGGVPLDVSMESIRQIGKKVIPHFHKKSSRKSKSRMVG